MNWLRRIIFSQDLAPTYTGVGHNYRWNSESGKYEELWENQDSSDVISWYYKAGQIISETSNKPHWVENDDARGRIETGTNTGSITFNTNNIDIQKQILNALIGKYSGVRFGVYEYGGPYTIQQYWDKIST